MAVLGCSLTDDYFVASGTGGATGGASAVMSPPLASVCGNGIAEGNEGCDRADLRGGSCAGLGLEGGTLACTSDCRFDISGCAADDTVCGDGVADQSEFCDGADLKTETCEKLGLTAGELSCTAACRFDTSRCTVRAPACGDGAAEGAEACDGIDLRGQTCTGLGLSEGTLLCSNLCQYVTSGCDAPVVECGDGRAEANESCDGDDLRDQTCEAIGLGPGTLGCTTSCAFDTSGCGALTPGCDTPAAELCDGQSNDCDDVIDEDACPEGCSARVYDDRLYILCVDEAAEQQLDYAKATAWCAAAGSELGLGVKLELSRVESAGENQFLKDWITGTTSSEGMIWMGANDIAREHTWVWGQGPGAVHFFQGRPLGGGDPRPGMFDDFQDGRPNSANGTDEDCGGFDSEAEWRWNDRLCTVGQLGYVCEQVGAATGPLPPTPPFPPPPKPRP